MVYLPSFFHLYPFSLACWLFLYQSINKRDHNDVKATQALAYQSTTEKDFIRLFSNKPIFYKALFNDDKAYQTVRKSQYSAQNIMV